MSLYSGGKALKLVLVFPPYITLKGDAAIFGFVLRRQR